MAAKKLTKSQINNLPAQYTFVDGVMVRKTAGQPKQQTQTEDWGAMASDTALEAGSDDDDMLFARR